MAKILLDYIFPISVVTPTPAASTAFLKQVCVVAKPKTGQEGNVGVMYECTSMTAVAARTDNTNAQQLFNAGMSKVYVLLMDDLGLAAPMATYANQFYTVLVSDDFDDDDIEATAATGTVTISSYANLLTTTPDTITVAGVVFTAQSGAATLGTATFRAATSNDVTAASLAAQINAHAVAGAKVTATVLTNVVTLTAKTTGVLPNAYTLVYTDNGAEVGASVSGATLTGGDGFSKGTFDGVVGYSSDDQDFLASFTTDPQHCGFYGNSTNKAKNMFYAFGTMLANLLNWTNQQYIAMPEDDGVDELGDANSFFDDKISFVIADDEFGKRLGLFAVGGEAIVKPYILKNLQIDMQSAALTWISANQPSYTKVEAALLETRLQEDVVNLYITTRKWISAGVVSVTLEEDNFVAAGRIDIAKPKALWRVFSELRQTL